MSGYLLDTNVVSELTRNVPHPDVVAFLSNRSDLWLSSIVIHELEYGLQLLPYGQRRRRVYAMKARIVSGYSNRILALDRRAAEWAARFRAQARRAGRVVDVGDALMAGIARSNDLAVATRNVADFEHLDLEVTNPWNWSAS